MPKCLRCNRVEVAADELYCESCKAPAKQANLRESRNMWALIGLVIPLCNFVGCYFWAKYKSRSKWFTLLGFSGLIGYIILAFLKNKSTITESNPQ